jgi:hypothetical protein
MHFQRKNGLWTDSFPFGKRPEFCCTPAVYSVQERFRAFGAIQARNLFPRRIFFPVAASLKVQVPPAG